MSGEVGSRAPDFALPDGGGEMWRLSEQRGKTIVLLFYPGDETPVCTKQLCSVRDRWPDYSATGAEIIGISTDSVESHSKFTANRNLPLRLLSDPEGVAVKAYNVGSWMPGKAARAVVVIDASGTIRYRKVEKLALFRPDDDEIIKAIRAAAA